MREPTLPAVSIVAMLLGCAGLAGPALLYCASAPNSFGQSMGLVSAPFAPAALFTPLTTGAGIS